MYNEVGIGKLSEPQIRKLLKGERVRIKHGSHHMVHLSHEQHKKLMAAHKKGSGITMQADPYQQELIGGSTFAQRLAERTRHAFAPVARAFTPARMHEIGNAFKPLGNELLHSAVSGLKGLVGSSKYASPFASSINQGLDSLEHQGHESIAGAGLKSHKRRGRGEGLREWMAKARGHASHAQHQIQNAGHALQQHAHNVNHQIQHAGHSMQQHAHHANHLLQQHASHANHLLQQHTGNVKHQLGLGIKAKRGRPRKHAAGGGALFPAGYGEGARHAVARGRSRGGRGLEGCGDGFY